MAFVSDFVPHGTADVALFDGDIDYLSVPVKIALMESGFEPDPSTHRLWSDISSDEVSGVGGYTAGGITLANKAQTQLDADTIELTADDAVWTVSSGTLTSGVAVVYETTDDTILGHLRFLNDATGEAEEKVTTTKLTIKFRATASAVSTADASATDVAGRVLAAMRALEGTHTVVGQHVAAVYHQNPNSTITGVVDDFINRIAAASGGRSVGLLEYEIANGATLNNLAAMANEIIARWQDGYQIMLSCHFPNPGVNPMGGYNWSSTNTCDFAALTTPGNAVHTRWFDWLARFTDPLPGDPNGDGFFAKLERAGVVVWWRPFHEWNVAGFWWSIKNPTIFLAGDSSSVRQAKADLFKLAYRQLQEFFNVTHDVHCILWGFHVQENNGSPGGATPPTYDEFYPGNDDIDFVSMSLYNNTWAGKLAKVITLHEQIPGKPVFLGEHGPNDNSSTAVAAGTYPMDMNIPLGHLTSAYIPGDTGSGCDFVVAISHWDIDWRSLPRQKNVETFMSHARMVHKQGLVF